MKNQFIHFSKILIISFLLYSKIYSQDFWKIISDENLPIVNSIANFNDNIVIGTTNGLYYYSETSDTIYPMAEEIFKGQWCHMLYVKNNSLYVLVPAFGIYRYNKKWESIKIYGESIFSYGGSIFVDKDTILVGDLGKIYYSFDNGINWGTIGENDSNTFYLVWSIFKSKNNRIFIGTECGLYKLTEYKNMQLLDLFNCGDIFSFAENSKGEIYVGGADRFISLYKSSNEGLTWNQIYSPDDSISLRINSILITSEDKVIFTSGRENGKGGIFFSTEGDSVYENNSTGIINNSIGDIVVNSKGTLFSASSFGTDNKVYKSVTPITDIQNTNKKSDLRLNLSQNFPNPFNPITKIHYTISNSGKVKIKVFDILGRELQEIVNDYKKVGSYEIEFNAGILPSGTYFYRIICEDQIITKKMIILK